MSSCLLGLFITVRLFFVGKLTNYLFGCIIKNKIIRMKQALRRVLIESRFMNHESIQKI